MVNIFAESTSPRLLFILDHIFNQTFKTGYRLFDDAEELKREGRPFINYSADASIGGLQIIPSALLFETGVRLVPAFRREDNGTDRLILDSESAGFDLFASCFFLLTRYEEYFHPKTDRHGRIIPETTWQGRENLVRLPLVDIWLNELAGKLNTDFGLDIRKPAFESLSTIDLDF
ncbi:MAG: hypothetical protein V4616_14585, partial [Bacteroidota bacterium]